MVPRVFHQTPPFPDPAFSTPRVFHTPAPRDPVPRPCVFHLAKPNVFYFIFSVSRASAQTKETHSKSMRFLVLLSVSFFLKFSKILNFFLRFGKHSFSVNSFISKVFFSNTSCIFIFTIATIFACDSHQQYRFMHKCNSTLNALSSIANQSAALP